MTKRFTHLQYIEHFMVNRMRDSDNEPTVSIIILNYNAGVLLDDCLESIFETKYKNFEVILVDNDSKDDSHIRCAKKYPKIKLIENKKNLGYCEGNNVGIRSSNGEFVVILNPDTIVEPNWLVELVSAFNKYGEGIYQPKFLTTNDHNVLMSTGNFIQLFGFGFSRGKGENDQKQYEKHEIIGYASGTCLFTSKKIMDELEMFDSFLFAYHDDLDICWRASLSDIKSHYVPSSIVYHPPEGFSFKWSSYKFYLLERNRIYCILTHYSRKTFFKMLPALFLVDFAVAMFYLKKGMLNAKIKASLNILINFKTILRKYDYIQSKRRINDKDIIKQFTDELAIPKQVAAKESSMMFNSFLKKLSEITRSCI